MPTREICVVDDDPSVRRALQRRLGDGRDDVRMFSSAEDFLKPFDGVSLIETIDALTKGS